MPTNEARKPSLEELRKIDASLSPGGSGALNSAFDDCPGFFAGIEAKAGELTWVFRSESGLSKSHLVPKIEWKFEPAPQRKPCGKFS